MALGNEILLVQDPDQGSQEFLSLLWQNGYVLTVIKAQDLPSKQGLGEQYGLVFWSLDVNSAEEIAALEDMTRIHSDVPCLVVLSRKDMGCLHRVINLGVQAVFIQPVDPMKITARVGQILARRRIERRRQEILSQIRPLVAELKQLNSIRLNQTEMPAMLHPIPFVATMQVGPISIHLNSREVYFEGKLVPLSSINFNYLTVLARYSPQPVPLEILIREAQGYGVTRMEVSQLARWHIHELRRALEPDPDNPIYLVTVRGIGYLLVG